MGFMAEVNRATGRASTTIATCMPGRSRIPTCSGAWSGTSAASIGDKGERLVADDGKMPGARFFPDATLNFAENLLRRSDDGEAIVFRGEDKVATRLTWRGAERAGLARCSRRLTRGRRRRRRPRRRHAAEPARRRSR